MTRFPRERGEPPQVKRLAGSHQALCSRRSLAISLRPFAMEDSRNHFRNNQSL